jgi:asparagine synthase (glutamine-hydrolysing)
MVEQHQSGRSDYSAPIWTLVMFEAFLRNCLGGVEERALAA